MKNKILILIMVVVLLLSGCTTNKMPKPELEDGMRGTLGIDKNINEKTIDNYLGRNDSVYYDMRMLIDKASYENIGGDSYLSGFIKGFEVVPYPYLAPVKDLPKEVGSGYSGETLFKIDNEGKYIANYEESMKILEYFFPKDKYIFLICGGGGYAGMTKNMLVSLGWNEDKIYNVGGHWYYKGENNIQVKNNNKYDFWKIPYHDINFSTLKGVK
ncbi:MAG: hypothetical protein GX951_00620 [Mollicutes bacterium]|nr:hypothetical protein [Mollicutes bacterium]